MCKTLITAETAKRIEAKCGTDVLFEVARQLSAIARGVESPQGFREALTASRRQMAENKAVKAMVRICRRADNDQIWLVRFGSRGGWNRIAILTKSDGTPY
jgi:hypothetical protein